MRSDASLALARPRRFPLRLCEVLEQEFVAIHGEPPDPPVWTLEAGQIALDAFAAHLRTPSQYPYGAAIRAVARRLGGERIVAPPNGAAAVPALERRLVEALNELITGAGDLYDPVLLGCSHPACRLSLLRAAPADGEPSEEQLQLNRLLLEAAFPTAVASIDSVRLGRLYERLHGLRGEHGMPSALCLSGGGIRSASFSLGVVQGLARAGALERFDYLSTVSGGGYLGSWLSTWIHRHPRGLEGVVAELAAPAQPETPSVSRVIAPEPGAIRFLRSYSHFLNPKPGLLAADTWTWIGIYLRNLTLNWLVLIPLLMLVVGLPRLYASVLHGWRASKLELFPLFFWTATLAAIVTLVCVTVNRPSASDPAVTAAAPDPGRARKLFERLRTRWSAQGLILALGTLPLLIFAMFMTLLLWGLPASRVPLSLTQVAGMLASSPGAWLASVPFAAFDYLMLWGEAIVVASYVVAMAMLPPQPWRKRAMELLAMLLAGAFTWALVALLLRLASKLGTSSEVVAATASFELHAASLYTILAVPTLVLAVLAGMTLFIGFVSKSRWIEDEDREWWARFGSWALIAIVAWIVLSAVTIVGPMLLLDSPRIVGAVGGISGLLAVLVGKSSLSPSHAKGPSGGEKGKLAAIAGRHTLALGSLVFLLVFLSFLSLLTSALLAWLMALPASPDGGFLPDFVRHGLGVDPRQVREACGTGPALGAWWESSVFARDGLHLQLACQTPWSLIGAVMLLWLALLAIGSLAINLNKFSLHAAYRIRIVRTFLGASRRHDRKPNPFTGFDPLDNMQMHELQPGLLREGDIRDLASFVRKLQSRDATAAQKRIAQLLRAPEIDRSGILGHRLDTAAPGEAVLKSLQQDLLERLNRLLQTASLERHEELLSLFPMTEEGKPRRRTVHHFVACGHPIFANRLLLEAAFPEDLCKFDFPPPPPHRLVHVINLTLNLVRGRRLAWQERKAAPFSVSPMHSGSYYLGYRRSRDYGGSDGGISIGTAAAISGAAVSPNMGYSSSPVTAMLLTLFNVRLGWWLGNPGVAGHATYTRAEPHFSVAPLVSEALGLTDDRNRYVYLSDGGHFDNMGVFEMVLRRCRLIVATDAGADPDYQFADLGNALRKIRIDLGIDIEIASLPMRRRENDKDTGVRYCAVGRIRYDRVDGPAAPDGLLVVLKPVICGGEPADVLNYKAQNPVFPQEPTVDQFFGESQFESYRRLGELAVATACAAAGEGGDPWAVRLARAVKDHVGESGLAADGWLDRWIERARRPAG